MKKIILSILLSFTIALTGCTLSLEPAEETTVGEIVVIPPRASLDHIEPDETEVSQLQSAWEEAQSEVLPAAPEEPEVIVIEIPSETTVTTTEATTVTTTEVVTTTQRKITSGRKSAEDILEEMSLSEKVGQVILARYPSGAAEQWHSTNSAVTLFMHRISTVKLLQLLRRNCSRYRWKMR